MSSARAPTSCSAARALRLAVLLFYIVPCAAMAEGEGISLLSTGPASIDAHTRQTITFMLLVENRGESPRDLVLESVLPEGWKGLTADGSFRAEAGATESRLAGFLVSSRAMAGTYPVTYRVYDPSDPAVEARFVLQVLVLPEPACAVRLLENPRFAAAGDSYQVVFSVANLGNTRLVIDLEVETQPEFPYELSGVERSGRLQLNIGEQVEVVAMVSTPSWLREATYSHLTMTAHVQDLHDTKPASATSRVEIVPTHLGRAHYLRTIGGYTETTAAVDFGMTTNAYLLSALSARGPLDEAGRNRISVNIRKRLGLDEDPWLNPSDRYSLALSSPSAELLLGDHSYSVSPLLSRAAYGRGLQASAELGPFGLKGFYYDNVWSADSRRGLGGTLGFTVPKGVDDDDPLYQAGLSALSDLEGRTGYGLWQQFDPMDLLSLQIDAALQSDPAGEVHPGLYAEAQGDQGTVYYRTSFLRAWTGFQATYADTQSFLLNGGVRLLEQRLDLHGSFLLADTNLELDPLLASADRDRQIRIGADWKPLLSGSPELSVDLENSRRQDLLTPAGYDNLQNRVRIGWRQRLGEALGLGLYSSLGHTQYLLDDSGALSQNSRLTLTYQPSIRLHADASLSYNGQWRNGASDWHSLGWNAGLYRAWERTDLDIGLQNQYYFDNQGYSGLQAGIDSRLTHRFRWGHTLSSTANAAFGMDRYGTMTPDYRLTITYSTPLEIPVGRRAEIAAVRGRVYREETNEPLKGVLLRLNGLAVATDKEGSFAFHLPHSGRYYLQMDRSRLPLDLIPNQPVPIEVNVDDLDSTVEIGMVRAGGVGGNVAMYGPEVQAAGPSVGPGSPPQDRVQDSAGEAGYSRLSGLGNVLVELSDGKETRRRLTDSNGDFIFPEMRPGAYTLKVAEGFIPTSLRLDRTTWEFHLAPGQQEAVEFRAIQERRRVRMVQTDLSVEVDKPPEHQGEWTVTLEPIPLSSASPPIPTDPLPPLPGPWPGPAAVEQPPAATPGQTVEPVAEPVEPLAPPAVLPSTAEPLPAGQTAENVAGPLAVSTPEPEPAPASVATPPAPGEAWIAAPAAATPDPAPGPTPDPAAGEPAVADPVAAIFPAPEPDAPIRCRPPAATLAEPPPSRPPSRRSSPRDPRCRSLSPPRPPRPLPRRP